MAKKKAGNGYPKYPWDRWLAKGRVRLRRGRDFDCKTHCMNVLFRGAAKARGRQVSISVEDGDVLVVTVKKGRVK